MVFKEIFAGTFTSLFLSVIIIGSFFAYTNTVPANTAILNSLLFFLNNKQVEAAEVIAVPRIPDPLSKGLVSFTFDDGFKSAYSFGAPLLDAAGIHATFYIISAYGDNHGYVTPEEVQELSRRGHEIGAHTKTHPNLTKISSARARREIFGSRDDLAALGIKVKSFAYPYGGYNPSVQTVLRDTGYFSARTIVEATVSTSTNPFELGGLSVYARTSLEKVKKFLDEAHDKKQWAILVFHRIDEKGNPISIPHETLQSIIEYVEAKGMRVVTVSEGKEFMLGK